MKISELLDEDTISELVTSIFRIRLDSGRSVGAVLTLNYPAGHVRALLTNAINETEVYGEVSTSVSTGSDQPDPLLAALGGNRQTYHFLTGKYPEDATTDCHVGPNCICQHKDQP